MLHNNDFVKSTSLIVLFYTILFFVIIPIHYQSHNNEESDIGMSFCCSINCLVIDLKSADMKVGFLSDSCSIQELL